ncbi:MAG: hypothetical protein DRI30_03085 [Chloroflexi bacterium]|nr:MAG: hypothetical protein DRI30_03085 [Chloroflexota bacterium]
MKADLMVISGQFNGPPGSANGGYAAGLLAQQLDAETVEVTLRAPPPLDVPLRIERADGTVRALLDDALIAEATASDLDVTAEVPAAVTWDEAVAAAEVYAGLKSHAFPTCVACGPKREPADGLRLFSGPVAGREVVASAWEPATWTAEADGRVAPAITWAALDCPGAWAINPSGRLTVVLGRLTVRIMTPPRAGERYVVSGWPLGEDGRKLFSGTALHSADGTLYAAARAVWIRVESF